MEVDGFTFDSTKEARRYCDLKLLERAGLITQLSMQPEWLLSMDGVRLCKYRADFSYYDSTSGAFVVEDVKSTATRTRVYLLKKKMMFLQHRINIVEI